ncbi:hypothetical protein BT63DRAFT_439169 [Microthyrium microscopicum]|uniref:Uncharacterized protein n=1 Tax=Microthyrium microscopicum TaxID=703497 RepID=A0A6A6UCZ6_9PEZI|nr:hypothetical protein BT63DRAFT_439169 [Microthyrium microscopicum]
MVSQYTAEGAVAYKKYNSKLRNAIAINKGKGYKKCHIAQFPNLEKFSTNSYGSIERAPGERICRHLLPHSNELCLQVFSKASDLDRHLRDQCDVNGDGASISKNSLPQSFDAEYLPQIAAFYERLVECLQAKTNVPAMLPVPMKTGIAASPNPTPTTASTTTTVSTVNLGPSINPVLNVNPVANVNSIPTVPNPTMSPVSMLSPASTSSPIRRSAAHNRTRGRATVLNASRRQSLANRLGEANKDYGEEERGFCLREITQKRNGPIYDFLFQSSRSCFTSHHYNGDLSESLQPGLEDGSGWASISGTASDYFGMEPRLFPTTTTMMMSNNDLQGN